MSDTSIPGPSETSKRKRGKNAPEATTKSKPGAKAKAKATPKRKPVPKKAADTGLTPAGIGDVDPEERWRRIAEAAYRRAEQRGFIGGDPIEDWLSAEQEVDEQLQRP